VKLIDRLSTKFFLRLFLIQIAVIIGQKILGVDYISDTMALGAMVYITGLLTIYKLEKKK
jgi:hypothetical protein